MGNTIASRVVSRFGIDRVIAVGFWLCVRLSRVHLDLGRSGPRWRLQLSGGLAHFSSNSLQQSRLVALAPHLAAATVALNTSVVYLGQSLGSIVGGRLVDAGLMTRAPLVALGLYGVCLLFSVLPRGLRARKLRRLEQHRRT